MPQNVSSASKDRPAWQAPGSIFIYRIRPYSLRKPMQLFIPHMSIKASPRATSQPSPEDETHHLATGYAKRR